VLDVLARRSPVTRLLVGGAALLVAERGLSAYPGAAAMAPVAIHVGAPQLANARRAFLAETGRTPDASELRGLVDAEIDDEVLYREARARGIDRLDPVVQRRLVNDAAFVDEDGSGDSGGNVEGYGATLALGIDRGDVVVRRRLIARMRALLEEEVLRREPSTDTLHLALARNAERFAQPARVYLTQLQLPSDGTPGARAHAQTLLTELQAGGNAGGAPCAPPRDRGAAPAATQLQRQSERDLDRLFGAAFAHAVFALPTGRWSGPVASPYGLHLVCVAEHEPARTPPLDAVRNQVRELVLREGAQAALRQALDELRRRYDVRVDGDAEAAG